MPTEPLIPATLAFQDGIPYADRYGDIYHSGDGGPGQAGHVFLAGNGLPQRWQGRARFAILETGFGLGLNFLSTWHAWRNDPQRCGRLHYVAIEKHPFRAGDLAQLHAGWRELEPLSAELRANWPVLTPGFHRLLLDGGRVILTLAFGDIADCLPQVDARIDAFYLDGFAPGRNPEMWAQDSLAPLARLAAPEATVATYTVAASVRAALAAAGFSCDKRPGFGRKRDMLAGRYAPRWTVPPHDVPHDRRAIVIGAGIAGSAVCERLAARGWQVDLVERHAAPAREASGNRAGVFKPLPSRDDNLVSRFTRTAFLFALRHWEHLGGIGRAFEGDACGVLQLPADASEARMMEAIADGVDSALLRWRDAAGVLAETGIPAAHGGWIIDGAGWLAPPSLCAALLDACGDRLRRHFSVDVASLERVDGEWRARDDGGRIVASAPHVVIASGSAAHRLAQAADLPLAALRGQTTHVPEQLLPLHGRVVIGDGYVTPAAGGICVVGATQDAETDTALRTADQRRNLARLARLMPSVTPPDDLPLAGHVALRSRAPDRLPLCGDLPDPAAPIAGTRLRDVPRLPGMHGLLGLGSRGLTWASLLAEMLASRLEGEPSPVGIALRDALDPARFALQAYRHRRAAGS